MKFDKNFLVLLLLAIVSVSIIHCIDGETRSYNRSKIHISIDVDSNGEKSLKGRYADLSQGKIKGIDISKEDDDDNDSLDDDADDEDQDDGRDDNDKNNGKGSVKHVGKENYAKITMAKGRDSKSVKNSSYIRKHGKKGSRKTKAVKKKHRKQGGKKVLKNRKKIWKVKGKARKTYSKNGKEKSNRKSKQRNKKRKKKDKFVPNPEGSPNPHNLKIPLTFNREDIHDESAQNKTKNENNDGKSTQSVTSNSSKTFNDGVTAKISNPGDAINLDNAATSKQGITLTDSATSDDNQISSNETSTSDVSANKENQAAIDRNGKDSNAEESKSQDAATDSNSKAASKIRDLTKEIVITTLKEVKKISDSTNSTYVNVKNGSGSPLLERMGK